METKKTKKPKQQSETPDYILGIFKKKQKENKKTKQKKKKKKKKTHTHMKSPV